MHNTSDEITLNNESESIFSCSTVKISSLGGTLDGNGAPDPHTTA